MSKGSNKAGTTYGLSDLVASHNDSLVPRGPLSVTNSIVITVVESCVISATVPIDGGGVDKGQANGTLNLNCEITHFLAAPNKMHKTTWNLSYFPSRTR